MKIITKRKIKKECWNLDFELIKWLNEHLKVYYRDAVQNMDLGYYKFKYHKQEYTQEQLIVRLIEITDKLKETYFTINEDVVELMDEMYDLLKLIHWSLWW